jgi:hypothetical protein
MRKALDRMPPEDYEFFSRVAQRFAMANINQSLVIYRELPHSQSSAIRSQMRIVRNPYSFLIWQPFHLKILLG